MNGIAQRRVAIAGIAMFLAGCSGSQSPISTSGAMPQTLPIEPHLRRGLSWMRPEAKNENLLYVADYGVGVIDYSYRPSRIKYVGLLASPQQAEGECVDKKQNVFVTAGAYGIFEYAHGGPTRLGSWRSPITSP